MNSKVTVTSEKINQLISKLCQIREFWLHEKRPFAGVIVSIYYNKIVAKSNRVAGILKEKILIMLLLGRSLMQKRQNILSHIFVY